MDALRVRHAVRYEFQAWTISELDLKFLTKHSAGHLPGQGMPDIPQGEQTLRRLIQDPPDCFEGHSRLGTWLKYQPGRRVEAFEVHEDALRRWPWCHQAVDACMWMVTDDMVTK